MNMNAKVPALKMLRQPSGRRVDTSLALTVGVVLAALLFAVLVGSMAGQGSWLFLGLFVGVLPVIRWPIEVALGLYALMLPFDSLTALGEGKTGTTLNLLIGAIAGAAILGIGLMRNRLRWPPRAAWLWLLFLGWNILSAAWALQTDVALHELVTSISLVLLYLAVVSWRATEKEFSRLTYLTIAGGCAASWTTIYLFSSGVSYLTFSRASLIVAGRETNPDRLAASLLLPLALVIAELLEAKNWKGKTLATLAAASLGYAILLTMSRASLVAAAVILGVYAVRMGFNRRIFIMGGLLLCLTVFMPANFFERIRDSLLTGGDGRLDIWRAGFTVLKKYWLLGAGFANFPVAYTDFAGFAKNFSGYGRGAHNAYLQVAVELGIVGVVLLALVLYAHFRQFWLLRSAEGELPASMVAVEAASWAMLAFSFFADMLWEKAFWMVLMFSLMAIRTRQHSELAPKSREIGESAYGRRH